MKLIMHSIAATLASALFTSAAACTDAADDTTVTTDAIIDGTTIPATVEPMATAERRPDFEVREVRPDIHELTYTDVTGAPRTFLAEVRTPEGRRGSRPVVVWSHGGGSGKQSTAKVGQDWGRAINHADYVFVALAHPGRSTDSRQALCTAVEAANCAEYKYLLWDRLHDARIAFSWLADAAAAGDEFIDMDRLVYGGHSAGAMAVMVMAGMESPLDAGVPMPTDHRPITFLAASPPGAEVNGFDAESFAGLDRPILMMTGPGDTTRSTTGPDRLAAFDLIEHDEVMLVSTFSEHVGHGTFNLSTDPCRRAGGTHDECRTTVRALATVAQRFILSAMSAEGLDAAGLIAATDGRLPDGMRLEAAG